MRRALPLLLVPALAAGRLRRAPRKGNERGDAGGAAARAPGPAGGRGRAGPRAGDGALPALPRGDPGDGDDPGGDAASRRPADRRQFGVRTGDRQHAPGDVAAPELAEAPAGRRRPVVDPVAEVDSEPYGNPTRTSSCARPRRVNVLRPAKRSPAPAGSATRSRRAARGDRALRPAARRVPELRAQRPGPVSEGAGLRRARPHGRGDRDHGAPDRREPAFRSTTTRCSSGAASTSSRGAAISTPRSAYSSVIGLGAGSSYHELALYKLGWTFYKQELYEEALHEIHRLLDYKVSIGYDFDQTHAEDDERRVADTFRVISLSFNNLGGPEAVPEYFLRPSGTAPTRTASTATSASTIWPSCATTTRRKTYKAFVALYPFHRRAAIQHARRGDLHRGRVPQARAGVEARVRVQVRAKAEYWRHFTPEEAPEVLAYLKDEPERPRDALSRRVSGAEEEEPRLASYREARRWYGDYLESFPADPDSPSDQLPARRSPSRARGLRRGGPAVRANGLRVRTACTHGRRPPATPRSTRTASS